MGAGDASTDALGGAGAGAAFGPWGAAAGGALGLAKYFLYDKPKYQRQLALAAATQRYSPWTHLTADTPNKPDPVGSALAPASQLGSLGQSLDNARNQAALQSALTQVLAKQGVNGLPTAAEASQSLNFGTQAPRYDMQTLQNQNLWLGNSPTYQQGVYNPNDYSMYKGVG